MHRFFISPENIKENIVYIDPEEARHIEVLRLTAGDTVMFFDGTGREYQVRLEGWESGILTGQIIHTGFGESEPALKLYLAQGIAKGDKMDTIIQKSVEIGVSAIYPVSCERSVVRLSGEKAPKRVQRWQSITREACKQCRRNLIPQVMPVMDFFTLLEKIGDKPAIMLYENEDKISLKSLLHKHFIETDGQELFLLIGPEGGFSPQEVEVASQQGVYTASLGPRILRTETAGLVAASIILYEYGELG
ncbi:MAG TPA: 16S rRNA (uracil(1498)-N(3))-methyltransferase [Gelria sp.]|jgi:16S rRNA (uracil1498-N3)-methyltransferase|nr:16S rRNA (uracil(1498)-N(3))-methyltransferase [Gelria sp.]